jgi:hypothetical protein
MDRDEVDRALARLGAEHEAIETSLLALQDHAGRRLLEGAELTGVTKERWAATEASITLLWAYFDAYSDALHHARRVRSRRRWSSREDLVELTELLNGAGVTVAGSARATANAPALAGSAKLSERFTLAELVDRMNDRTPPPSTWWWPPTPCGRRCPRGSTCSPRSSSAPGASRTRWGCGRASTRRGTTWSGSRGR